MARVRIQSIVVRCEYEIKRALEDAVARVLSDVQVDRSHLFREFATAVGRRASNWVNVSDSDVEVTCRNCGERT